METYMKKCRIIMCCDKLSMISQPLKSRMQMIRVGAPTSTQIQELLSRIITLEEDVSGENITCISESCERNLNRAILMLQSSRTSVPEWEKFVAELAKHVATEQSPQCLLLVRRGFYDILTNCVPPSQLMKKFIYSLSQQTKSDIACKEIYRQGAIYEYQMVCGNRPIYHLEALAANAMSIFRKYA